MIPFSVLDLAPIVLGGSAADAFRNTLDLARHAERWGFRRYWLAEHHNMPGVASAATSVVIGFVAGGTSTIRVGAGGIMLPNHAPLVIAEQFGTLESLYPGRIDLGLGRAPGTDPLTAHVLRRGIDVDPAAEFPQQVGELLAFLGDGFPAGHPYGRLVAAPVVDERPDLFVLGSSRYGPRFAAVNGMSAVFAHHMSPEIAVEVLPDYRREFAPRPAQPEPYSAMSVLTFASEDPEAVLDFEAGWTLTIQNLVRGIRELLRPEEVRDFARSPGFRRAPRDEARMVTGEPKAVAERLLELRDAAQVDEIVVVTPGLDRQRRTDSLRSLAEAWRRAAGR